MQCPSCDHQAPQADFGDPLRCPDCGAFYQKALEILERKAGVIAGSRASSQAANDGSSGERVFLEKDGVKVTNTRFIVTGQTYAMASVNSVKVDVNNVSPSGAMPATISVFSIIWLLVLLSSESIYWGYFPVALSLVVAGIWWASSLKTKFEYIIILTTSSGETSALKSENESDIRVIEKALIEAIVSRG